MKRHAVTPTASKPKPRPDWRRTNPHYQTSPVERGLEDGKPVVWIDGGKLADLAFMGVK